MPKKEELKNLIQEAFDAAFKNPTDENLENYKNLVELYKMNEARENLDISLKEKKELSEREKFAKTLRETLGSMPTGSTIAIPNEVSAEIERKRKDFSNLRRYCTVHPCSGNYSIQVEGTGVTVGYVAEHGSIGDGTPTIDNVTLTAYKLGALVKLSNEFINDEVVDIVLYITTLIAEGFAEYEDKEILFGSGSNAMTGVLTKLEGVSGKPNIVTCATASTVTWAEVKSAIQKLKKGYRQKAVIVMSQELADAIHEFKNGSNYIFPQNDPVSRILGCDVIIDKNLSGVTSSSTADQPMMVVGDFSYYHIADRQGLEIQRLNELFAQNDQIGIKATERIDGKLTQTEAFAALYSKKASA